MGYRIYSVFMTVIFLILLYRLLVIIKEKVEVEKINKEIKWKNYRLQIINKNIYYIFILANQKEAIKNYFNRHQIDNVSIYGMNEVGKACVQLFVDAGVNVCYCIDKNTNILNEYVEIRQVENIDDQADIIIVATEMYFKEINESIKTGIPIRKLSEVLEEVLVTSHKY